MYRKNIVPRGAMMTLCLFAIAVRVHDWRRSVAFAARQFLAMRILFCSVACLASLTLRGCACFARMSLGVPGCGLRSSCCCRCCQSWCCFAFLSLAVAYASLRTSRKCEEKYSTHTQASARDACVSSAIATAVICNFSFGSQPFASSIQATRAKQPPPPNPNPIPNETITFAERRAF